MITFSTIAAALGSIAVGKIFGEVGDVVFSKAGSSFKNYRERVERERLQRLKETLDAMKNGN